MLILRVCVAILAMAVAGSALTVAIRYMWSAARQGRTPGRILARHVAFVAFGTSGLTVGYAIAIYEQVFGTPILGSTARLGIYLGAMLLLLIGVFDLGRYQRLRAANYPQRQAAVRDHIRAAMEGHPVSGPRSADYVAVLAANAVLRLDGTPALPEPTPVRDRPNRATSPADTRVTNPRPRHARREEPR